MATAVMTTAVMVVMHKTGDLCTFVHGFCRAVVAGPKTAVKFCLCGNQQDNLCQNMALWEATAAAASVTPKWPVRITAGEGHHTGGTEGSLPWEARIHRSI
jgi:hypothetical protein